MKAADIMTRAVATLMRGSNMLDAVKLISEQKVRQIPVVDEGGRVMGVITPRSLIKAILPRYVTEGLLEDIRFAPELPGFIENMEALAKKGIEEVLDKNYVSVNEETQTMEVAALFIHPKKTPESILVVDGEKRLLGIISPWDIFKRLMEMVSKGK